METKTKILISLMGGLLLTELPSIQAQLATEKEERLIQTEQERIDLDKSVPDTTKVNTLSQQFNVPPATVQGLRDKGQGWGETSIELSMAQQLFKTDPKTYPTIGDALTKVESLRAEKMGWGKIAKELGFKLGPVIRETRHARKELRENGAEEKHESMKDEKREERRERHDKSDLPDRNERSERPEAAEHHENVERAIHVDHPGH